MYTSSSLSCLLVSLQASLAMAAPSLPQRPVSFSTPSQHPALTYPPTPDEPSYSRGVIDVLSCGLRQAIPVTYFHSSKVCNPVVPEIPYLITDLAQNLLNEHLEAISFPYSSSSPTSSLPIHLEASITVQLYRSKFVLGLSLQLSPLESTWKAVEASSWRSIVGVLEKSAHEVNRAARMSDGSSLGSVLVLEAEVLEVHILAEWTFWRVVDGLAQLCET